MMLLGRGLPRGWDFAQMEVRKSGGSKYWSNLLKQRKYTNYEKVTSPETT